MEIVDFVTSLHKHVDMMIVISERKVIAFQEIDICLKVIDSAAKPP